VADPASFYREIFGFETTYESDWYVSLRLGAFELGIVAQDHATIPAAYAALPSGVIVNVEVDEVDALYERLSGRSDLRMVMALRDEDFGQRHFMVAAPDGVLIDVIQPTQPSEEYERGYIKR
jgi:uncharacterized glyoxalase superfamily protein PhnB